MSDNATILMHRMGVKTEKVKTGLFGHELRTVLDGECGDSEVLCAVRKDGTNARVVNVDKSGSFAKDQVPKDDEMLFAVRRTPFRFSLRIDAGKDADGYGWAFDVDGFAELLRPECFAATFRGVVTEAVPYSVSMLETHFGTITSTIMHDRIVVDVLGVMALNDKDAQDRYVDMQYRLEQSREVGEKLVSEAINVAFFELLNGADAVKTNVTFFHATSADREAQLSADDAHDAEIRKQAVEIATLQHDIEVAKLNNEKAKVEADTEALKAKSKAFLSNAEALDRLMNMNFAPTSAPNLQKIIAAVDKGETVARIMSVCDSAMRNQSRIELDLEPRTRAIGPRLRVMKQGWRYGLSLTPPRNGHLVILDICDDHSVIPIVPCIDSKTQSSFVCGEQTVVIGQSNSPWIAEPFEQYDNSGIDRFVAFVTDEPVLTAKDSVVFGRELPADVILLLAERLERLSPSEICGGLMQVRIEAR